MTVYKQLLGIKQKYQTISYLAFITHIDLLQQSARQSKDVIEWFVPKGACDLAVFGEGAHGLSLIHFCYQLMEYLHSYHTVIHWALLVVKEGQNEWEGMRETQLVYYCEQLTLRNLPTSSKISLKTNTFLSPSNHPCFVIRAISYKKQEGRKETHSKTYGVVGKGGRREWKGEQEKLLSCTNRTQQNNDAREHS